MSTRPDYRRCSLAQSQLPSSAATVAVYRERRDALRAYIRRASATTPRLGRRQTAAVAAAAAAACDNRRAQTSLHDCDVRSRTCTRMRARVVAAAAGARAACGGEASEARAQSPSSRRSAARPSTCSAWPLISARYRAASARALAHSSLIVARLAARLAAARRTCARAT